MGPPSARIFLNAGGAQPGESVAVNQILPSQEFVCRQHIPAASFLGRQEPAANGYHDFGLATNDPALRIGMREVCNCQGAAVRPNDAPRRAMVSGHREPQVRGIVRWVAVGTVSGARSTWGHQTSPGPGDRRAGQGASLIGGISAVKIIWSTRNWRRSSSLINILVSPVRLRWSRLRLRLTGRPPSPLTRRLDRRQNHCAQSCGA
jgi:hypothetical protein